MNQPEEYGLVMPFVCTTPDGPYDDASFVAGMRVQEIWQQLTVRNAMQIWQYPYEIYVEPELIKQLDLVAMHFGWKLETEPWDEFPDEWVLAKFERNNPHLEEVEDV